MADAEHEYVRDVAAEAYRQSVASEPKRANGYEDISREVSEFAADVERLFGKREAIARGQAIVDELIEESARFPRKWLDDVQPDKGENYYVKGLIERRKLIVVYGPSGDGKTFFTTDLVGHIACGISWRGRRVRQGLVVYVAAEAGASILRRFFAWRERHLSELRDGRTPLAIITRGANLLNQLDVEALLLELRSITTEAGMPLALVVFDTYSRSTPGGDENAGQDTTRAIAAADLIRDETGASTLFVHHTGKDVGKGARGHSSFPAAADLSISVVERVATVDKSRDGVKGDQFPFSLEVMELGHDQDGDAITTCIVKHIETTATTKHREPLTSAEKVCLKALRDSLSESGEQMPHTSALPGGKGVQIDAWRGTFYRRYGEGQKSAAAVKAFQRANVALQAKGYSGVSAPWAWIC